MNEFYELATLSFPLLFVSKASEGARAFINEPEAKGELLGCWRTDIGTLGRLLILRGFANPEDLTAERRRALFSANPFNAGSVVTTLEMDSYAPFPFLPRIKPGSYGRVYEFRTYKLKPGGLPPTLAGWEAAMPAREPMSHLVINMYALDGAPRITHIWPYAGVDERFAIRAKSYADGIWPPKGGPEQILEATSTIALPEPYSPLS
ncbi:NIPSNAP family protein [Rhodopila sp.]|uniref:NIPSNAP family protein n=1 Tax=Rhodopila sp. TaxID=2480087 RepID=UPI003D14CEB5